MGEEKQKDDIDNILSVAVRSESSSEETIAWSGRPDASQMPLQLLKIPLLWLAGLFLYAYGTITKEAVDGDQFFRLVIFVFLLIAVMGIAEIIAIPIQARKTIVVSTNVRTFIIKLIGKFGYSGMDDYSLVSKKIIRPEKNTLYFFYAYTIPFQLIFLILLGDVLLKILQDFNIFCFSGFACLVMGWFYQWYYDFRIPMPRFREVGKVHFFFNEWIMSVESMEHKLVDRVYARESKAGVGNIFLVSKERGCMRIKSIPDAKEAAQKIENLIEEAKKKQSETPSDERTKEGQDTPDNQPDD